MNIVLTSEFRVSYPSVFKPKKNDLSGKDEYQVVALFGKGADLSKLKAAAQEAIEEKWGKDPKKWPQNLRSPFRKHEEKKYENEKGEMVFPAGMEEGGIFINLKATQKPGLVDANNQDIIDESQFYGGCYARAAVRAYAYDQKGNRGVAFGLQALQKAKDGDPLGSRVKAQDLFAPIEGAAASTGAAGLFD